MMLRKTDALQVKVYRYGKYIVEIVTNSNGEQEAWLRHKDYGISRFMFGCGSEYGEQSFVELVEKNLEDEIEFYEEEVQDHDDVCKV